MSHEDVSTPIAAAVFIGSAVLVGAPVTYVVLAVVLNVVSFVLNLLDVSFAPGTGLTTLLVLVAVALVAWLWMRISYEVAQLRLYGVSALSRGSRAGTLARYLTVWAAVLVAVVFLVVTGVFSTLALVSSQPIVGLAGLVTAVAGLWVFARAGLAFREGFEATVR